MVPADAARRPCPRVIRVGVELFGGPAWRGGYNYLLNLLTVLGRQSPDEIAAVLFVAPDVPTSELAPFATLAALEIVVDPYFAAANTGRRNVTAFVTGRDAGAAAHFTANRIDVAFTNASLLGRNFPLPIVAWLPDFQHRRMPHLFGRAAWWRREIGFRLQIVEARVVLVSSAAARDDAAVFYPGAKAVHIARFAIPAPMVLDREADRAIAARLDLPEQYFFLPNQFWTHKNHEVAIRAIVLVRQQVPGAVVVATGAADPRDPWRLAALQNLIAASGVSDGMRMLGTQPYATVGALLRTSAALINPSRFEGWSTTVEEAKACGVPMILSDIVVHREQAGHAAAYFGTDDPPALASAMLARLARPSQAVPLGKLQRAAAARTAAFAESFAAAVRAAAGDGQLARRAVAV